MALSCEYKLLWDFLKLLGIDILKSRCESEHQAQISVVKKFVNLLLKFMYPTILYIMQIYGIVSWTILYCHGAATMEVVIAFSVSHLYSVALWQDVYRKMDLVKSLIRNCNQMEYLLEMSQTKTSPKDYTVNLSLYISVCIPVVLTVYFGFIDSELSPEYVMYYSLFMIFVNQSIVSILVRSLMMFISFTILYLVPSIMVIFACTMYYKVSSLFKGMHENLKDVSKLSPQYKIIFVMMRNYNYLYHLAYQTENTFSLTSLLLLSSQCFTLYLVLVTFFKVEKESFFQALYWESIVRLIMGPLFVSAVVMSASSINSQIRKIRMCLQMIHSSLLYNSEINYKALQLVTSMMNMEFPQMTAYGILDLKPSLILTSLGSVLTYGLLVLNMKKT